MPIRFRCPCGKLLEADEGTEGRRTKCPACQLIQSIPAQEPTGIGLELASAKPSSPPPQGSTCPNCGKPLAAEALLCVQCGYNARTGAVAGAAAGPAAEPPVRAADEPAAQAPPGAPSEELEEEAAGPRFSLPVKKIVGGAAVLVVLALAWFLVIKPLSSGMNMSSARSLFTNGDLDEAAAKYKEIREKVSPENRALCDLRVKQIALEKKLNAGRIFSEGQNKIAPRNLEMTLHTGPPSGGALSFKIHFRNSTQEAITLKKDYFYLRGSSDIVTVTEHQDNELGQVVKPGERVSGLAHFRRLPQFKANRKLGRRTEKVYFMMYNDGKHYVKWLLPF